MISRTKMNLDRSAITAAFDKAGISGITDISPLGDGEYNAVYSVDADRHYVIKAAPPEEVAVLTYEKNMMQTEIYWYDLIRRNTDIRVPQVYFSDFSKETIKTDYFIMEKLEGIQRSELKADKSEINKSTAQMLSKIHKIKGDGFGYVQNGLYENWYEALSSMISNLVSDAKRAGKKSLRGERLLDYAGKYKDILMNVPSCMVNYDLWDPNVICSEKENGDISYAWIDPERSFWGDKIFDFICIGNPADSLENKKEDIDFYNGFSDSPVSINRETVIRYAFAQGLISLVMEVEKYYRYTPRHFGWWRNVVSSNIMYKKCFEVLKNG
ncbi:MAG TPA: aminoglycoside phosphotransferase family protein [Candidatus Eubacterium faecigallinarum]|nr:aminoglycoside phosphotransferase family protein [Candidatus Eubacterium faecigallinarum]